MKKLLLTSAGIVPEIKKEFISLLPKKPEEIKVVFITTAAYGCSGGINSFFVEEAHRSLRDCGIKSIEDVDIKDKNKAELAKIVFSTDVVLVNGGNTFYLLYWLKKSGFDQIIQDFVNKGGLYVGVSAGSYIACPTIEAAGWKHADNNKVKITDLTALNLVPFLITAHFQESYGEIVDKAAKLTKYPIVALSDTQAVLVLGDVFKIIGSGKKNTWNHFPHTVKSLI